MTEDKRQKPPLFRTPEMDDLRLGERRWFTAMQPEFRYLCTRLEFWRHCRLPRCRRSRACTGSNDLSTRDRRFPPCIRDNDDHATLLREMRLYEAELQAAYHCFSDEPET